MLSFSMGYFIFLLFKNLQVLQCRMFGEKIEMKIFNSKGDEEVKDGKELHNEEFYKFYSIPAFVRWV